MPSNRWKTGSELPTDIWRPIIRALKWHYQCPFQWYEYLQKSKETESSRTIILASLFWFRNRPPVPRFLYAIRHELEIGAEFISATNKLCILHASMSPFRFYFKIQKERTRTNSRVKSNQNSNWFQSFDTIFDPLIYPSSPPPWSHPVFAWVVNRP